MFESLLVLFNRISYNDEYSAWAFLHSLHRAGSMDHIRFI